MAFPTALNSQITDAVTQSNVKVIGESPAIALGSLYQTVAHAASIAGQNLVTQQQNAHNLSQALVTRCVQSLVGSANK